MGNREVTKKLIQARSNDPDLRLSAALEIGLLLEKHSPLHDSEDFYQAMLPPELVSISLTADDEVEMVREIGEIVLSDYCTPKVVWALSKSNSLEALRYLLALLTEGSSKLSSDCIWEALIGINKFASVQRNDPLRDSIHALFREKKTNQALEAITVGNDQELASLASRIIKKV